jgi:hypothetical protein
MPAPLLPTFAGSYLFGPASVCVVRPNPVGRTTTAFPGVIGLQTTNMGGRGYSAQIEGVLFGEDLATLGLAFAAIDAYHQDGGLYLFTDSFGSAYQAIMGPVEQDGAVLPWDSYHGFGRHFRVSLLIPK